MLNLENLKKFYINDFGEKKIVFDNLNLKIKKGDFVCIMGGMVLVKQLFLIQF